MAYQQEPSRPEASPTFRRNRRGNYLAFAIVIATMAALFWFFSAERDHNLQSVKPSARPGAAHTDQRHLKQQPFPPGGKTTGHTGEPGNFNRAPLTPQR
jgi:hypothetical protein